MAERFAAFLRAVNVGKRRVAMATAREQLESLGYTDVASFVNSGNLLFGFEITAFVRTAAQVQALATEKPFGKLRPGHTHFVLLPLTSLTAAERRAVEAMSNKQDEVVIVGRDVHWLIRDKSTETSLGPKEWKQALPDNPTTARNTTMIERLAARL